MIEVNRRRLMTRIALDGLGGLLVVISVLSVLYYWDPTRIYVMQFKADDVFQYDKIDSRYLAMNPRDYVSVSHQSDVRATRDRLIEVIWGKAGVPEEGPEEINSDLFAGDGPQFDCGEKEYDETQLRLLCQADHYRNWPNLAGIDELVTHVGPAYTASMAFFRPEEPNGTLVIYQNGYASTYHAQYVYLKELVAAGYSVMAANHIGYGDNYCFLPVEKRAWCDVGWGEFEVPLPMRVHFSPLAKAINYGMRLKGIRQVAMVGFSAGGWLTSVMAAVDPRVSKSYPVAGFMPPFLQREGEKVPNQKYAPLFEAASMLDQFILGASGPGRGQLQIFNKYDRCCFAGERALIYEPTVRSAVSRLGTGTFDVVIDDTHPRHKISRWAFDKIMADLEQMHEQRN